ncbi:MAG: heavy metal transporter [Verrucomicrobia bacterium]|nr:MAG: heavy metal transporter [Verrucomicrobiota bacterium]
MKKQLIVIGITFACTAAVSADTIKATVNGMVCSFCATGIEKTFKAQPEIKAVNVDLNHKLVTVTTKEGQTLDDKKLTQLLKNSGYSVASIQHAK